MREYIEEAGQAGNVAALLDSFDRAVRRLNFEHYALSSWESKVHPGATHGRGHRMVALKYPSAWVNRYIEQDYFTQDPVLRHARSTITPYQWCDLSVHNGRELMVLQEANDAGLRHGLAIPIHEPLGKVFLATLASERASPVDSGERFAVASQVQALAVIFHARHTALAGPEPTRSRVELTPREGECLGWVAQGKSSWDIGQLMAVSEHTVNFHLKNAMRKFNTASRVTAAVRAVTLGLVQLP